MTIWPSASRTCIAFAILASVPSGAHACMPPAIAFAFGSVRLDAEDRAELTRVAAEIRRIPDGMVTLVAQSDGSDANVRMSRRRAEAVREALMRRGVPAGSISTEIRGPGRHVIDGGGRMARWVVMLVASRPADRC